MKLCGLLAGLLLVAHSAFAATLREAIRAGELEQVRASLDAGASANETDDLGATPLHDAVWLGEEAIVRLLVDRGARVDSKHTEAGSTPLLFAALRGHTAILEFLVEHGAGVNAANSAGGTSLHFAARRGDVAIARILLEHGADAGRRDREGVSPLDEAASQGNAELAGVLLEHDRDTGSALMAADSLSMLSLLLEQGRYSPEKLGERLLRAVSKNHVGAVRLLLQRGAPARTPGGVQFAAARGLAGVAAALLDAGADANQPDPAGVPPLHEAALQGHADVIRVLVAHGAKLDQTEPETGSTPLYGAASMGRLEVVRVLLDLGADRTRRSNSGRTPREAAASSGFSEIVEILR